MGNQCCSSCTGEKKEEVKDLDTQSKWRVSKEMHMRALSSQTVETTVVLPSEKSITKLQGAVRLYLSRKSLQSLESEMLDFPEDPNAQPLATSEALIDPASLLTASAQYTLNRLPFFLCNLRVKGVFVQSPRFLKNGSVYVGQWSLTSEGTVMRGKGKQFGSDGGYFHGYWTNGLPHHRGRQVLPNGDLYEGSFHLGLRSGQGTYESQDQKNVYQGEWKEGKREGKGQETFANGSSYVGEYQRDKKSGKGMIQWSDGTLYEGDFQDDQVTGIGTFKWCNGRVYIGEMLNCRMHGRGLFTYPDGSSYEGEYFNDKKSGRGVYRWAGNVYDGQWSKGKMDGLGYLTLSGKETKMYQFRKGAKVRKVEAEQSDPSLFN